MGPPGFTYEQVVDFIERTTIGLKDNLVNYDKDLLIEFLKTPIGQNHIDQYYNDITDEVLLDYLENQIYDEELKSRIENCICLKFFVFLLFDVVSICGRGNHDGVRGTAGFPGELPTGARDPDLQPRGIQVAPRP